MFGSYDVGLLKLYYYFMYAFIVYFTFFFPLTEHGPNWRANGQRNNQQQQEQPSCPNPQGFCANNISTTTTVVDMGLWMPPLPPLFSLFPQNPRLIIISKCSLGPRPPWDIGDALRATETSPWRFCFCVRHIECLLFVFIISRGTRHRRKAMMC